MHARTHVQAYIRVYIRKYIMDYMNGVNPYIYMHADVCKQIQAYLNFDYTAFFVWKNSKIEHP